MATAGTTQFDLYMQKAATYHAKSLWQEKLRVLLAAQECIIEGLPEAGICKQRVLTEIGGVRRRFGQYEEGIKTLELALDANPEALPVTQAQIFGEMGVMYRHCNDFATAFQTFNKQFQLASQMGTQEGEIEMCRAIGNEGVSAYNLSQQQIPQDEKLLQTATKQLQERISRAQKLHDRLLVEDPKSNHIAISHSWKIIGMDRLTLCYIAAGKTAEAVRVAKESQQIQGELEPTVRAFSRFYYGNALWSDGQRAEAIQQWSAEPGTCGSAAALCKEPSAEHASFLERLAKAGIDFSIYDEQGFSPLDYAVLSDNRDAKQMIEIVTAALREQLRNATPRLTDFQIDQEILRQLAQANLRRYYRVILQEHIRPELRNVESGSVRNVRRIYNDILVKDPSKRSFLDEFHFVPYNDFKALGKLPVVNELRPGTREKLTKQISESVESDSDGKPLFIVFFSYRWIGRFSHPPIDGPDDHDNTQYRRMVDAMETLMRQKELDPEFVGIWLVSAFRCVHNAISTFAVESETCAFAISLTYIQDCACISQADKLVRERGINTLPLAIIQCDAMISLMDDEYRSRAWCSVEVRLMCELIRSYHLYNWWEHRLCSSADAVKGILEPGTEHRGLDIGQMGLTDEKTDRPKIDFLVRQSKLMGRDDA